MFLAEGAAVVRVLSDFTKCAVGQMCGPNGDGELRTSVYPSNMAPIGAKLRQHAFRTICNFRFFDSEKKIEKNWFRKSVFHRFRQIFEELDDF